jgi:hypothetical protein
LSRPFSSRWWESFGGLGRAAGGTPHPPAGRSGLCALSTHNPSAGESPAFVSRQTDGFAKTLVPGHPLPKGSACPTSLAGHRGRIGKLALSQGVCLKCGFIVRQDGVGREPTPHPSGDGWRKRRRRTPSLPRGAGLEFLHFSRRWLWSRVHVSLWQTEGSERRATSGADG